MLHLMKLELKKFPPRKYILLSLFAIAASMFFTFAALNDSGHLDNRTTYMSAITEVGLIFAAIYILFFAVMNATIVVNEYEWKTIQIMFTYPLNRKMLIAAKLFLITGFAAVSMCAGYLCCGSFLVFMDAKWDLLEGSFEIAVLGQWVTTAASTMVVCCALGLWSFAVGMFTKSVPATIVSAILFFLLRQIVFASTDIYYDTPMEIVLVLLITAGLLIYVFQRKIQE